MSEVRTKAQLLQTAIDSLTIIRAKITTMPEKNLAADWIFDEAERDALDLVLKSLKDCREQI